jgi:hypothetical protein
MKMYQYFKQSWELLPLLGLPRGGPIPPDFSLPPTVVEGVEYRIIPRPTEGRRHHRVQVHCAHCGEWLPAGRYHQHLGLYQRRRT